MASLTLPATSGSGRRRPKLLFLATEDWYFWSDRLPFARAARDAGCDIVVAARVRAHGEAIRAEGFALHPLDWRRRGDGPLGACRAVLAIARLYRAERPDIINHLALKPVVFGALARRLAFGRAGSAAVVIDWIMGLGLGFAGRGLRDRLLRPLLGLALRFAASGIDGSMVVQNGDDGAVLAALGIAAERIVVIRGSGVDAQRFAPLPDPAGATPSGATVAVGFVSRMLKSKGVLDAVAAVRRLRAQGLPVELLLAGAGDPDSRDSLSEAALAALGAEPGIIRLGRVEDVRTVWARAAIAVLPSIYGEGLPRALLEAAACARAIVASDMPGCREIVRDGETGILVPPEDVAGLAAAIARLAADPGLRRRMGAAGRALVEREFAQEIVAQQTMALYQAALAERGNRR